MLKALTLLTVAALVLPFAFEGSPPSAAEDGLSISGTVWLDWNFDGIRQADEDGWSQINVILIGPAGQMTATTDEAGRYSFDGLEPGQYRVQLAWAHGTTYLTSPVRENRGPYEVSVTLGSSSVENVDFGLFYVRISSPDGVPVFQGLAFSNGDPVADARVSAFIGNRDCTGPIGVSSPVRDAYSYVLSVASDALIPGCGKPGDSITFTINGEPANQTAEWQAVPAPVDDRTPPGYISPEPPSAANRNHLDLTVGPPVAWWVPSVEPLELSIIDEDMYIEAFVDGTLCGRADRPGRRGVLLVVASDDLRPGCGVEGAVVTFSVKGRPATENVVWSEGAQGPLTLALPQGAPPAHFAPKTPPATGSAGLR